MSNVHQRSESKTTERVAEAAHSAVDSAAAKATEFEKKVREKVSTANEKLSDSQHTASEQVAKSIKELEDFARNRPIAATGIAFAAGVLAAALLRR